MTAMLRRCKFTICENVSRYGDWTAEDFPVEMVVQDRGGQVTLFHRQGYSQNPLPDCRFLKRT